ncbi:hypothetical protein GCM10025868_29640 [Angustibacter aerolatus]|uniref:Uncharacterized protein n=1 Tax=Angustibacter aerolatus TaxID=1162965 RepID=A0ABQ6JJZ9_9ACTN|nr:hypothetical protein GCM10025868_29640 [Angustibacter aerolatus]
MAELRLQPVALDRVDRAERLVHQQHRRVGGERTRHADALLLAPDRLVRVTVAVLRGIEADQARAGSSARARARCLSQPSRLGTVMTFCRTRSWGNRPLAWMTYPIRRRRLHRVDVRHVLAVQARCCRGWARSDG